ncbi:uncharacterized protein LOC129616583 [Condylostylus longicornis]|uniref:uncharacterized protein LOC129616583 n=1 Tax=Condylostylus longicornis TaxID=2530218 RepID=UPI00244E00F9|nr:uncharacterized protein LOC129616583 [Condylostylus longicornis]
MAAAGPARNGLTGLLKQGWNEIPDVVGGSVLAVVGLVLGTIGVSRYYSLDMDNRKYKIGFVVMRPEDPKAAKVHKD